VQSSSQIISTNTQLYTDWKLAVSTLSDVNYFITNIQLSTGQIALAVTQPEH